jgi:hypothetical protein
MFPIIINKLLLLLVLGKSFYIFPGKYTQTSGAGFHVSGYR